ncbi:MAG TPA: ABC transporter substrate-binding protein [Candidatus Limnocylindrales bacterium]|nr:ABC transporter substrate-binding protein [Candidatus Limnocylindrales bacterium]
MHSIALPVSLGAAARRWLAVLAAFTVVVAACGGGTSSPTAAGASTGASAAPSPSTGASGGASASPAAEPASLTVGLGYIPSVQFAQFYLAQHAGYYGDAGLTVTLQNKIDPDLITLLGQGAVDIGSGDGTSVIPAVSQGIPVIYTATIYGEFPSIVVAKADSGIASAADLEGKRIGIPGKYGSSWVMLQALLQSADLTPADVTMVEFPDFGQATALQQGTVDAATGFANNEPIQLQNAGIEPVVLTVDDVVPLPGPGLVTGTQTLGAKGDALRRFTEATLRAMEEIAADPQKGLDASFALVPDLAQDPGLQRQILDATIATWGAPPYGAIDREGWQESLDFMSSIGLVANPITVDQLVTESLLGG